MEYLILAAILYMISGALIQWALYFEAIEILAYFKITAEKKLKFAVKSWPLTAALAWPAVLWAMRKK